MKIFKPFSVLFILLCLLTFLFSQTVIANQPPDEKSPIIYAASGAWFPLINPSESKGACGGGLFFEILNEIFTKQLGVDLGCSFVPWKRAQKEVKNGDSDFLVTVPTAERQEYSTATDNPVLNQQGSRHTDSGWYAGTTE